MTEMQENMFMFTAGMVGLFGGVGIAAGAITLGLRPLYVNGLSAAWAALVMTYALWRVL